MKWAFMHGFRTAEEREEGMKKPPRAERFVVESGQDL